jgi:hypothetical protein
LIVIAGRKISRGAADLFLNADPTICDQVIVCGRIESLDTLHMLGVHAEPERPKVMNGAGKHQQVAKRNLL